LQKLFNLSLNSNILSYWSLYVKATAKMKHMIHGLTGYKRIKGSRRLDGQPGKTAKGIPDQKVWECIWQGCEQLLTKKGSVYKEGKWKARLKCCTRLEKSKDKSRPHFKVWQKILSRFIITLPRDGMENHCLITWLT